MNACRNKVDYCMNLILRQKYLHFEGETNSVADPINIAKIN